MPQRERATFSALLENYLLESDLKESSEKWYRRIGNVYLTWADADPERSLLDSATVSTFLRDKQKEGLATHYCRSLRNGLMAILGDRVDRRIVRPVKLASLNPRTWTPEEVRLLVARCDVLPKRKVNYYRRLIAFAYHSGLSKNDCHLVEMQDVLSDGTVLMDRNKTGAEVVVWVPTKILSGLPLDGPIFPRLWSDEQFRKDFKRIVRAAGLHGTFKKLRKSSGTEADIIAPGRGHEHLANSRKVFEAHYKDRTRIHRQPIRLPEVFLEPMPPT